MVMMANALKMSLLCWGCFACLMIGGCMTSMERARMMYRNMPGFDQPSLVEAGSGWVLVNSSSGTISLNAPASGKVSHYLRGLVAP